MYEEIEDGVNEDLPALLSHHFNKNIRNPSEEDSYERYKLGKKRTTWNEDKDEEEIVKKGAMSRSEE